MTPWFKKSHFTKYVDILKREIRMFTFIHLNFEWKHSNLRLRLYLHGIKAIDKYKMIAKILRPLIQINIPLMLYINEIQMSSQEYKKRLYEFFFTARYSLSSSSTHRRPCFLLRNIMKNAETHPSFLSLLTLWATYYQLCSHLYWFFPWNQYLAITHINAKINYVNWKCDQRSVKSCVFWKS